MKKSFFKKIFSILLCVALLFCGACEEEYEDSQQVCEHEWKEATCERAKYCKNCYLEEGSPLGHDWTEATCFSSKKCKRCNKSSGIHLNHEGGEATCSKRPICEKCNQEYGFKLNHSLKDGVCEDCGYEHSVTDSSYFDFTLLENGSYSIKVKDKENLPTKVVIPATYENASVTQIEKRGFASCLNLEEIEIPTSVTQIEEEAFLNCPSLIEIALPEGVSEIKKDTFLYCVSLNRIKIPSTLTYIAKDAFFACYNLHETHLAEVGSWFNISFAGTNDNPVTKSRYLYFENQTVKEMTVPEGVLKINSNALSYVAIERVEFSKTVCEIDSGAFRFCESLKEIAFSGGYGSLIKIGSFAFEGCVNLQEVDLSNSPILKEIGSYAFNDCNNLKRVYAYDLNSWLNITFNSEEANPLFNNADLYVGGKLVQTLEIPEDIQSINKYTFSGCQSIQKLVLHKDVLAIERYAFHNCSSLAEISYTDRSRLRTIGSSAFYNCESLLELIIPESVQSIGDYAFNKCSKLKKVVFEFGSKVTTLGSCFDSCPELEYVELPYKLTDLREDFSSSPKLRQIENGIAYVDGWVVGVVEDVRTLRFKNGTKGIGLSIPYRTAEGIKKIYIPKSVRCITKGAFANCTSATFYCEVQSKPNTWIDNWNPLNRSVVWGYTEESTDSSSSTSSSNNSNSSAS